MPRIQKTKDHKLFKKLHKASKSMGDGNSCTVIAAAVLTGLSYQECFDAFEKAGRIKGKGCVLAVQKDALKLLGFKFVPYKLNTIKMRYRGAHRKLKGFTTFHPIRFSYAWEGTPDLWLDCRTHAAAYRDGKVIDWSNDKKRRFTTAYRVVPIEKPVKFSIASPSITTGDSNPNLETI